MTKNISRAPQITSDSIKLLIDGLVSDSSHIKINGLDGLDDLNKYVVLKCLSENITNDPELSKLIRTLKETPTYEYYLRNLSYQHSNNKLIQVPIFTENNDDFVRFVTKTEDLNYELLTNPRGFKIPEGNEDLFYVKRDVNRKLEDCLKENQDVLIKGQMKIGKTRLVFDVLRDSKELRNSYVFSIYQEAFIRIDTLKVSDSFNKVKKNKLIWFIDDLHYFKSGKQDLLWRMYENLTAKLGKVTVIATSRSDEKEINSWILKDMENIKLLPWSHKEGKELSDHYGYPMEKFTGTAFSLIKDIERMKELYNSKSIDINCKWVMRYLKLLQEILQLVDSNLLEDVFLSFRKRYHETDIIEKSFSKLEQSGFIEIKDNYIMSWEPYLEEIVTKEKDYPGMESDMEKLIEIFIQLKVFKELIYLGIYFTIKGFYGNSINCYKAVAENVTEKEDVSFKAPAYFHWGTALCLLAKKNNEEKIFKDACDKFEKSIEWQENVPETYYNLGTTLSDLARLKNNDESLFIKACDYYNKAIEYKEDYSEAYNNLGNTYYDLARIKNNDENFLKKACDCHNKAIEYKEDCPEAYYNLGIVLSDLARLKNNDENLFKKACDYYNKAIECEEDFVEAYYNLGIALSDLARLKNNDENLFKKACNYYEKAIEYKEDYPEAYHNLGNTYYELVRLKGYDESLFEKACNYLEKAIEYKEDYPEAYYNLGTAHLLFAELKSNDESLFRKTCNYLEKAIQYKDDYPAAYNNLGNACYDLSRLKNNDESLLKKACDYYEKAIEYKKDYPEAYHNLGNVYAYSAIFKNNDENLLKNACKCYEKAVQYKKDYSEAYNGWACTLCILASIYNYEKEIYRKACEYFSLAVKYKKDFAEAYNGWGKLFLMLNQLEYYDKSLIKKACKRFNSAIKIDNKYSEAYNNLAISLNVYERLLNNNKTAKNITKLLLASYLLSILQNKLESIPHIIELFKFKVTNDLKDEIYTYIISIFQVALNFIHTPGKLSNIDIDLITNAKGKVEETDIVINALLERKVPDDMVIPNNNFLLQAAVYLARQIISKNESN